MNINNEIFILKPHTLYRHIKFDKSIRSVSIVFCSKIEPISEENEDFATYQLF